MMIIGSIIAFMLAQLIDVISFHQIKALTGERMIWLRATGSTAISQFIDSFVILFIAFKMGPTLFGGVAPWSWSQLLAVGVIQYTYKLLMAIALTPVLYLVHDWIERYLGREQAAEMKKRAMGWN